MKLIYLLFTIFIFQFFTAQIKVSGFVLDQEKNAPISFADIKIIGANLYTSSNSDGSFFIQSDETHSQISIEKEGYESQIIDIKPGANYDMIIMLAKRQDTALEEVTVVGRKTKYKNKKENPAYKILREVWARKKVSGLKKFNNYQYEEYEKIEFDLNNIDSSFTNRKIFKNMEFIFDNIDTSYVSGKAYLPIFMNEAIYNVVGRNKPTKRERKDLIANKSSGFEDNEIVSQSVKNMYSEIDIYENRMNFFTKAFVSPVARDGFSVYEYQLIDSLEMDGVKTYHIKYYPKRSDEYTFKGNLYITAGNYAVKEATLQSTKGINVNFVRDIYVELNYNIVQDSIFLPDRTYVLLDMSLITKKDESLGMFAHKVTSYTNYEFNDVKTDEYFDTRWDPHLQGAFEKEDEYWETNRHEPLNKDQRNIYATLDRLQEVPKFKRMVGLVETIASGYINIGHGIDVGNIYSMFGYNEVEGLRIRLGARTYFSRNDMWRLAGYIAYGFGDDQFKYGAEFRYMFNRHNRFTMGIGTKRDIEQTSVELLNDNGIMTRTFASSSLLSRGNNAFLSNINKTNAFISIEPWKNVVLRLDGTYQTITSANPVGFNINYYLNGKEKSTLYDSHLTLSFQASPGAKYSNYGIDRFKHVTRYPTFILSWTKGLKGVLNSGFDYDKLQFHYDQPILWGTIGKSDISVELGKIFNSVPISLLPILPGNQSYSLSNNTFSQMNYYEFITDTYATGSIEHHFNGAILSRIPLIKKLKLREIGFIRTAWGSISEENQQINASRFNYVAPEDQLYVEYGFGIENIGLGNWRIFRIDFNWRGNYLDLPNVSKFGIKFGFQVEF